MCVKCVPKKVVRSPGYYFVTMHSDEDVAKKPDLMSVAYVHRAGFPKTRTDGTEVLGYDWFVEIGNGVIPNRVNVFGRATSVHGTRGWRALRKLTRQEIAARKWLRQPSKRG